MNFKEDKKEIILKQNILNECILDKITALEYKLIIVSLSKVNKKAKKLYPIKITLKEFCRLVQLNERNMYTHIKNICKKLMTRYISIKKGKDKLVFYAWMSSIDYDNGTITLEFNYKLASEILNIAKERGYTKYFIQNIANMDSKYAMRVYELNKQYEKIGMRSINIDELKSMIGAHKVKSYKNYAQFKREALQPAKKEINLKSDIIIDFKEIRKGRKVVEVEFMIKSKIKSNSNDFDGFTKNELIQCIQGKIYARTAYSIYANLFMQYHRLVLIEFIKKFEKKTFDRVDIAHPKAFFTWHIEDINKNYDKKQLFNTIKDY